jgi:thiol:disulfide interchange protein
VATPIAVASATPNPKPKPTPNSEYTTPLLDGPALAQMIQSTCQTAISARRPILLEFSAPWCADCIALEKLKRAPALSNELQRWQLLPINVGSGDQHPELMRAFRVDAIAKLVVVFPRNCAAPVGTWPQGAARTLDGLRKHTEGADRELAEWLASVRADLRR